MLRRSHKKSRGGCLQCKRRHVKCDERRPACVQCAISERTCTYTTPAPLEKHSTPRIPSHEPTAGPGDHHQSVPASRHGFLHGASDSSADSPESTINNNQIPIRDKVANPATSLIAASYPGAHLLDRSQYVHHELDLEEAVNLNHMELLIHSLLERETLFCLGDRSAAWPKGQTLGLKTCLESPYVLHQMLAFSARHLAYVHPERQEFYLHQADTLQTRAVSLYNAAWTNTKVDKSNCVALLLFSTVLAHHLLADTLAKRDPGGLEPFLTHYLQCIELHRGIHAIFLDARPFLMETELEPVLSSSAAFTSRDPKGDHCRQITELIDDAQGLTEEDKEACRLAISYLQVGFDAVFAAEEEEKRFQNPYQMIFSWLMLAPPDFTRLLAAKTPEALVLLSYYTLLLHYGRSKWQVQDAGVYILGLIRDYLGPQWDPMLEYPQRMMAEDMK